MSSISIPQVESVSMRLGDIVALAPVPPISMPRALLARSRAQPAHGGRQRISCQLGKGCVRVEGTKGIGCERIDWVLTRWSGCSQYRRSGFTLPVIEWAGINDLRRDGRAAKVRGLVDTT